MTLSEYYLKYMSELCEGQRKAPEALHITASEPMARAEQLEKALATMSVPDFVRLCAAECGDKLPESLFENFSDDDFAASLLAAMGGNEPQESPAEEEATEPEVDPDKDKHAFEVFCDCIELDDKLVSYLIEILRNKDRLSFYKLSQIATKLDLDPDEFLYWLAHREDYGTEEEAVCAAIMDGCFERLMSEKKVELLAALLSGDQKTFELFRVDAPELQHLPIATFEWFAENYLDRDYPLRFILKCNGVTFPDKLPEEKP